MAAMIRWETDSRVPRDEIWFVDSRGRKVGAIIGLKTQDGEPAVDKVFKALVPEAWRFDFKKRRGE